MIVEEDAPRPRPAEQPTTCDRGSSPTDDDVPEPVTTKHRVALPPVREPTTRLVDLGSVPSEDRPAPRGADEPPMLTQMVPAPPVSESDGVVMSSVRRDTLPVDQHAANMSRAAVSIVNGATWLRSCGHESLATLLVGMSKTWDGKPEQLGVIEFIGAKLAHDLVRHEGPLAEEQLGMMLVQIAKRIGVDPHARTMRKIASDSIDKAKTYEKQAASSSPVERERLLVRANELREHAQALRKATR